MRQIREITKEESIILRMLRLHTRKTFLVSIPALVGRIISWHYGYMPPIPVTVVLGILLLILYAHLSVFYYRVYKNWYGNNEYEAIKILHFINKQKNPHNNDGDGRKKVRPKIEPIKEEKTVSVIQPGLGGQNA